MAHDIHLLVLEPLSLAHFPQNNPFIPISRHPGSRPQATRREDRQSGAFFTFRNRLQKFVSNSRTLLSEEFTRQLQNDYGLDPSMGTVSPLENLGHLDDTRRETARILRDTLAHYLASSPSGGVREALERIIREQAFTVLNRLSSSVANFSLNSTSERG